MFNQKTQSTKLFLTSLDCLPLSIAYFTSEKNLCICFVERDADAFVCKFKRETRHSYFNTIAPVFISPTCSPEFYYWIRFADFHQNAVFTLYCDRRKYLICSFQNTYLQWWRLIQDCCENMAILSCIRI